jgi:hypothetical protein
LCRDHWRALDMQQKTLKWSGRVDSLIPGSLVFAARTSMARFGTTLASGLVTAGVIAAYVLLEWVSFIHEYKGVPITPWNPGLALVFGCMMLSGARYSAALFVGAVIAEIAVLHSNLWWPIISRERRSCGNHFCSRSRSTADTHWERRTHSSTLR